MTLNPKDLVSPRIHKFQRKHLNPTIKLYNKTIIKTLTNKKIICNRIKNYLLTKKYNNLHKTIKIFISVNIIIMLISTATILKSKIYIKTNKSFKGIQHLC